MTREQINADILDAVRHGVEAAVTLTLRPTPSEALTALARLGVTAAWLTALSMMAAVTR